MHEFTFTAHSDWGCIGVCCDGGSIYGLLKMVEGIMNEIRTKCFKHVMWRPLPLILLRVVRRKGSFDWICCKRNIVSLKLRMKYLILLKTEMFITPTIVEFMTD